MYIHCSILTHSLTLVYKWYWFLFAITAVFCDTCVQLLQINTATASFQVGGIACEDERRARNCEELREPERDVLIAVWQLGKPVGSTYRHRDAAAAAVAMTTADNNCCQCQPYAMYPQSPDASERHNSTRLSPYGRQIAARPPVRTANCCRATTLRRHAIARPFATSPPTFIFGRLFLHRCLVLFIIPVKDEL